MNKLRWGVLSTARIGTHKVIPAMQKSEFCEVAGIASRNSEKAKHIADQLNIPKAYGSYEAILADNQIDAEEKSFLKLCNLRVKIPTEVVFVTENYYLLLGVAKANFRNLYAQGV